MIGGGNSGFEESLFLTRFARQVDIVVAEPVPKASKILQEKVAEMSSISVTLNHQIVELRGKQHLEQVIAQDKATGEKKAWQYDGVFVFIGLSPNSDLVKGQSAGGPQGLHCDRPQPDEHPARAVRRRRCARRVDQTGGIRRRRRRDRGLDDPPNFARDWIKRPAHD